MSVNLSLNTPKELTLIIKCEKERDEMFENQVNPIEGMRVQFKATPPTEKESPFGVPVLERRTDHYELEISPEVAAMILAKFSYERQRNIRPHSVETYVEMMRSGNFIESDLSFGLCEGKLYLLNGQHRLHGVIKSGVTLVFNCLITKYKTHEDMGKKYSRIDDEVRRTPHDTIKALGLPEHYDLTASNTTLFWTAAGHIISGFADTKTPSVISLSRNRELRVAVMDKWSDYSHEWFRMVKEAPSDLQHDLRKGPIIAVGITTIKYQPNYAKVFWETFMSQSGLKHGNPDYALTMFVRNIPVKKIYAPDYCRRIATCWNAYYENRGLKNVREGKPPIRICGTPFNEKRSLRINPSTIEFEDIPEKPK
jgi:hypothetical protein